MSTYHTKLGDAADGPTCRGQQSALQRCLLLAPAAVLKAESYDKPKPRLSCSQQYVGCMLPEKQHACGREKETLHHQA